MGGGIDLAKGGSPKLKLSTINQVWPKQGEANPAVSTVFELFKEPLSSAGFTAEFQKQMLNIRYNLHVQPESQKALCVGGGSVYTMSGSSSAESPSFVATMRNCWF